MPADPTQLEFLNEAERQYFAEAVIGVEVREFLTSSVGRYLHGCAKMEYDRCRDEIFDLELYTPEGKRKYEKLKLDAWAASHFMRWCVEAITKGDEAEKMLYNIREGEQE